MLIKFDVDSDLYDKIEALVKSGKYQDIYQFIRLALTNQIQEEQSMYDSAQKSSLSIPLKIKQKQDELSQGLLRALSDIPLEASQIPPPKEDLIWSFYNRFFPIKIIIRQLAIIIGHQDGWVELNKFQEEAYNSAESWASKLKQYEEEKNLIRNEKLSTGLPTPYSELSSARGGFQKKKIEQKILASKMRFLDQFVGRLTKKSTPYKFEGACFDMVLIGVKVEGKTCYVTLTEAGRQFALLENPILDKENFDDPFSKEEVDFVLHKIISRFPLEQQIIIRILDELSTKSLNSDDLDLLFTEEKLKFYKKKKPENKKEKEQFEKEIIRERVATMGRLSELRKVIWSIDSQGKSIYRLP